MKKKSMVLAILLSLQTISYAAVVSDDYGGKVLSAPNTETELVNEDVVRSQRKGNAANPLKLNADKAEYNQETGDFFADGNVVLKQNGQIIKADYAEGNMNTGDIYLKNGGEMIDEKTVLHAEWAHYNFIDKTGEIEKINGENIGKQEWYRSPSAKIKNGRVVCEDGATISRCPSVKHPACLSIEAKSFEVIPHEKMIAKDCWVKMRGKKIIHRDRWINDLTQKQRQTKFMPHIGWDDDYGMKYSLEVEQPLWKGGSMGGDLTYYGMAHWKPWYYVRHDTKDFNIILGNGWDDDDGDWYKKQMNWEFNWKRHRLIKGLPFTYSAFVEHGLWQKKDDDDEYSPCSWHTEYGAYLYHDPIHFFNSNKNSLNLYVGKKWTRESFTDEHASTNLYGATLTQSFDKYFKVWTGYYDAKSTSSLFDLNNPDMEKELRPGVQYVFPGGKNILTAVYRLDVGKGRRYEYDLTWLHHFCCWDLSVSYEREFVEQDHSIRVQYHFNFL